MGSGKQGYGAQRTDAMKLLTKEQREVPTVAWPTLVLFTFVYVAFFCTAHARVVGTVTGPTAFIFNTLWVFILFTPLHDAVHGSVARAPWVNSVLGRLAAIPFVAPYPAFKHVHLEHHAHTNDPVKDPDYWSGTGPTIMKPLRWLTQDLHYYVPYFSGNKNKKRFELVESLSIVILSYGSVVWCFAHGYGWEVATAWLLPARTAAALLGYSFDYVPHRPHKVTSKESIYASTSKVGSRWLDFVLLYQNYHNIHHLYPFLPFYQYAKIWFANKDELVKRGTPIVPFYDPKTPWL